MGIVLIVRITAQRLVLIIVQRMSERIQISIEITIHRTKARIVVIIQTIGLTVALGIAVLIAVAELQVHLTGNRLAVGCAHRVAPVVLRRHVVTVGNGRIEHRKQVDIAVGHRLADTLTPVTVQLDGDVTAVITQTAVKLQHTTQRLRVAIVDTVVQLIVLDDTIFLGKLQHVEQWVVRIFVRILVERGIQTDVRTVVGAVREVRAEHDVRHRVRLPFQAHLTVPLVCTGVVLRIAITERRRGTTEETLRSTLRESITVTVVPAHTTVNGQHVGLLVVQVHTGHLHGVQTLTASTETTTATTAGESHVVGIVGISHQEHLHVVLHHATEQAACIATLRTG